MFKGKRKQTGRGFNVSYFGIVPSCRGSPLARRLKEREKEKEADTRDRQREKEEIEELKRKLLDQGHPDPEAELARVR